MAIELRGKPIVITGAGTGIGRATATACARAGMPVVLTGRREAPLAEASRAIEAQGGRAAWLAGDVTDTTHCDAAVALCMSRFGSVYAVFANAGYGVEATAADMPDEDLRAIFETNVFGTMNILRPALAQMRAARAGHALLCSSCLAKLSIPHFGAYCATKAAQHHLARAMGIELRNDGVFVSSVHPVGTRTPFFDTAEDLRRQAARRGSRTPGIVRSTTPDAFMQSPERVANAVVRRLRRPAPEVWTSLPARVGFTLAGLFPGVTDAVLARMLRRRLHAAASGGGQ